jgi:hypothetical protein
MGHESLVNSKVELEQMAAMLNRRINEKYTEVEALVRELHKVEARLSTEFA